MTYDTVSHLMEIVLLRSGQIKDNLTKLFLMWYHTNFLDGIICSYRLIRLPCSFWTWKFELTFVLYLNDKNRIWCNFWKFCSSCFFLDQFYSVCLSLTIFTQIGSVYISVTQFGSVLLIFNQFGTVLLSLHQFGSVYMIVHSWFNSYAPKLLSIFYYRDKTRVQIKGWI